MELNPEELDATQRYKLLTGGVTPRPIAVVSSISPDGVVNVAPFSFFNAAGATPMMLMFVVATRSDGVDKDTLRNVRPVSEGGTGELVVNLAVEAYARRMSATAHPLEYGDSELERVGFEPAPSQVVEPPRLAASPIAYECRTDRVIALGDGAAGTGNLVLARVVHVYVRDDVINERFHIDHEKVATIGRMGGRLYTRSRERFPLANSLAALDAAPPFEEDTGAR